MPFLVGISSNTRRAAPRSPQAA
uniref:Uncharacterized protein n=1 Tax=Arundo donax TaxID=35708 RepID=A0A0A9H1E8_ARUDO